MTTKTVRVNRDITVAISRYSSDVIVVYYKGRAVWESGLRTGHKAKQTLVKPLGLAV